MQPKRPQLNLTELHQLEWLLGGALAMLSAWSVLYLEVEAWWLLGLITLSVPVVLRWPRLTLHVPRWVHRLAFPLFICLAATDYYLGKETMPALLRLALMLVFYRSVTPRRRRDNLQLIVLGLFLVVVAGVLSVSLVFAFQIVAFTGCTLALLLVMNLIDAAESGQTVEPYALAAPPPWMHLEWMQLARRLLEATDWRVATLGAGLFAGVVGLSTLLFFALPRIELSQNLFLNTLFSQKSKTGFSETVRFGDVTDIQQDTSVALRVDVSDPRQLPANCYWRMLVLDEYAKGQFSMSAELKRQLRDQRQPAERLTGGSQARSGAARWTFYLEAGTSRYLPLLGDFSQLQFADGPQEYAINDALRVVRLQQTPAKMFAYRVEGMRPETALGPPEFAPPRDATGGAVHGAHDAAGGKPASVTLPALLELKLKPEDRDRVEGWVRALQAPADDAAAFARQASDWLERAHAYALQVTLTEGNGDPLVRWMASASPGHCELFAGAFTLLARAAGYPTRMVTGFHGGSWNPTSGNLTVRNSDAHAWCEIFSAPTQTWLRVDPTPGQTGVARNDQPENPEALLARISDRSWTAKLDGLRMFWYRRIVDFDQKSQTELARGAKVALERRAQQLKQSFRKLLSEVGDWLQQPWELHRLLAGAGLLAGAVAAGLGWQYFAREVWRRWGTGLGRPGMDPVRREAGYWLRKLSGTQPRGGDVAATLQVRAELERLRYGPKGSWPEARGTFRRARRAYR
jgi:transglutaminase-like putative cysteine protease